MQDAPQENPKKLFVGNLSWNTTKDTLVSIFSEHGTIEDAVLITDKMSGRSKGIAFVTFETEESAQAAITALNGYELDGREIIVNIARPRAPRDDRGGYNRHSGGDNDRRGGNRSNFGGGRPSRY
jgi:cold-inducible RNA-binding protein